MLSDAFSKEIINIRFEQFESNGNRSKTLSLKEYLDKINPYLKDIIDNLNKSDTWKIQWIMTINFMSSEDTDET